MAKGHFEKVKLCNLSANDLIRLGRLFQHASPAVKTLYYETTECSSIIALASVGLKPESLIVRNEDPRGAPLQTDFLDLVPILGPTLQTLSLHRLPFPDCHWWRSALQLSHLTSLTMTGFGFAALCILIHITTLEEVILDFKDEIVDQHGPQVTRTSVFLPSLRVFKLRNVPCPAEMSLPTVIFHAPRLRTLHLDSTSAALWLLAFSGPDVPANLVDFRVDRPNGPAVELSHLQPFLCDTIESFALTSISHELRPLLCDIETGLILPRQKHLEFTFHDE
jgi:hypothetical protein